MEGDLGCWLHQCGGQRCDGPVGVRGVRVPGGRCAIEPRRHHVAHHSTRKSPRKNWQVCPQPSACCRSVRPTWACRCRVPRCIWGYPPGSRPGAVARVPESQRIPSNKFRSCQWCECPGHNRGWLGEAPGASFLGAEGSLAEAKGTSCRFVATNCAEAVPL